MKIIFYWRKPVSVKKENRVFGDTLSFFFNRDVKYNLFFLPFYPPGQCSYSLEGFVWIGAKSNSSSGAALGHAGNASWFRLNQTAATTTIAVDWRNAPARQGLFIPTINISPNSLSSSSHISNCNSELVWSPIKAIPTRFGQILTHLSRKQAIEVELMVGFVSNETSIITSANLKYCFMKFVRYVCICFRPTV